MKNLAVVFLFPALLGSADATPRIENLQSVSSTQIAQGLGFNANPASTWELKAVRDAGGTEVRFQPAWSNISTMAGVFNLGPATETALDNCYSLGLQPLMVAAYGPPFHALLTVHVSQSDPVGSYDIPVQESIASVNPPACQILEASRAQITARWGYPGSLIDSVNADTRTLTLASKTTVALDAGAALVVNQLEYPSCATNLGTDPSVVAYCGYAAYLAGRIGAHTPNRPNGLTGRVELWNEPPWAHDPWDGRTRYYDAGRLPAGITGSGPQVGFIQNLKDTTLPGNVRYNWGGTNKSGAWSLLGFRMPTPLTQAEAANSLSFEAFHPYGATPEADLWDPALLAQATTGGQAMCTNLMGGNAGSNFKYARWVAVQNLAKYGWTIGQNITETGLATANEVAKARFVTRQFLGYQADGFDRITFYRLYGANDAYSFVTYDKATATMTPLPAYTAIQGLMSDVAKIGAPPHSYAPSDLPSVAAYDGPYPLVVASVVGRRSANSTQNSILFALWQSSYPLTPAKDLTAVPADSSVKLTWSTDFGALRYVVARAAKTGGPYTPVATVNAAWSAKAIAAKNTYTDSGLQAGATYYYVVTAQDDAYTAGASNEVSAVASAGGVVNNAALPAAPALTFDTLPPTTPASVTVRLPTGYKAVAAWNITSRAPVSIKSNGNQVTYSVADDIVFLDVEPQ